MKKRVLLVDESLTVQKVVALTLDKNRYVLSFAKSRAEVMKLAVEAPPDLILVSDQVSDINIPTFPKELEAWLNGVRPVPPIVLITGHDIKEQRHYVGVLKKPFAPQALQALVTEHTQNVVSAAEPPAREMAPEEFEDQRLQKIFNDTFADEATLVRETFKSEMEAEEVTQISPAQAARLQTPRPPMPRSESRPANQASSLWGEPPSAPKPQKELNDLWGSERESSASVPPPPLPSMNDAAVEAAVGNDISAAVERVLARIVPPIVERLVSERLDRLLKDQEQFFEIKP